MRYSFHQQRRQIIGVNKLKGLKRRKKHAGKTAIQRASPQKKGKSCKAEMTRTAQRAVKKI